MDHLSIPCNKLADPCRPPDNHRSRSSQTPRGLMCLALSLAHCPATRPTIFGTGHYLDCSLCCSFLYFSLEPKMALSYECLVLRTYFAFKFAKMYEPPGWQICFLGSSRAGDGEKANASPGTARKAEAIRIRCATARCLPILSAWGAAWRWHRRSSRDAPGSVTPTSASLPESPCVCLVSCLARFARNGTGRRL